MKNLIVPGEPQEECVRCGKMFLSSASGGAPGSKCPSCLALGQVTPVKAASLRSCGDSGSEESSCTTGTERDEEDV